MSLVEGSEASSQILAPKRRQIKQEISAATSQASEMKKKELKKRKKKVAGFFDEEAELGSDDEENDDMRKLINKNDVDENEEGLDSDLEEFVVRGDEVLIPDAEREAFEKFKQDMENDDKLRTRQVMRAALFGNNKKRQRNQVEGLDDSDGDNFEKMRRERIEEREQALNS